MAKRMTKKAEEGLATILQVWVKESSCAVERINRDSKYYSTKVDIAWKVEKFLEMQAAYNWMASRRIGIREWGKLYYIWNKEEKLLKWVKPKIDKRETMTIRKKQKFLLELPNKDIFQNI